MPERKLSADEDPCRRQECRKEGSGSLIPVASKVTPDSTVSGEEESKTGVFPESEIVLSAKDIFNGGRKFPKLIVGKVYLSPLL